VTIVDEEGFILSLDDNARQMFACPVRSKAGILPTCSLPRMEQRHRLTALADRSRRLAAAPLRRRAGDGRVFRCSCHPWKSAGQRRSAFRPAHPRCQRRAGAGRPAGPGQELGHSPGADEIRFLANVSHELRTPLNAIVGMSYLLRHDPLPPDQLERVEHIDQAGQQLLD
jgi:signal transduction histidine kinase